MCAISGFFQNDNVKNLNPNKIQQIKDTMNHRGPDNFGYKKGKKFYLFHNRLSIIDLEERSNQPMVSNCKNFVIVFNGEIYNYIELKRELSKSYNFNTKSDTEVLLAAYKKWGVGCLDHIFGAFAFCIYDIKNNIAFLARDRFGQKPLFFWRSSNKLFFSSEVKFFNIFGYSNKMDMNIWQNYLQLAKTDNTRNTFFKDISKLLPGEFMIFKNNNLKIKKWYDLSKKISENKYKNFKEVKEKLFYQLEQAIILNSRSDAQISISLSGGLDSNTLLSFYNNSKIFSNIPKTYSVYFENFNTEKKLINSTKNFFKFDSKFVKFEKKNFIKNSDDLIKVSESPTGGLMNVALMEMYKTVKKDKNKVILDGTGLDEILAGYDVSHLIYLYQLKKSKSKYFKKALNLFSTFNKLSSIAAEQKIKKFNPNIYNSIDGFKLSKEIINTKKFNHKLTLDKKSQDKDLLYQHIIDYLQYTKIPRNNRLKDMASMSNSLELRLPFLEHKLVEMCFSIPREYIFYDGSSKSILRHLMKKKIPDNLRIKQKISKQSPQNNWLKMNPFKSYFEDMINSKKFKERGLFNQKKVEKEWQIFLNQDIDTSFFIWQTYCTETWCKTFLD